MRLRVVADPLTRPKLDAAPRGVSFRIISSSTAGSHHTSGLRILVLVAPDSLRQNGIYLAACIRKLEQAAIANITSPCSSTRSPCHKA